MAELCHKIQTLGRAGSMADTGDALYRLEAEFQGAARTLDDEKGRLIQRTDPSTQRSQRDAEEMHET